MALNQTDISWCDFTLNPAAGCSPVSPGCANCYAAEQAAVVARRFREIRPDDARKYMELATVKPGRTNWTGSVALFPERMDAPRKRKKPATIFLGSMTDLLYEQIPEDFLWRIVSMIRECSQHTFMVLTKREHRLPWLNSTMLATGGWPPNLYMGCTVESQDHVGRVTALQAIRANRRFLSVEPMLGPITFPDLTGVHLVITGGESGNNFRPFNPAWASAVRDQCAAAGVAFHHKQNGGRNPSGDYLLDGMEHRAMPEKGLASGKV